MSSKDMVINYVPGEECRVAVIEDGRLEEFHAERMDSAGHVGNIYVGRVVNVEPAIQAAFVDFGLEHNGFLHVSDLHPRYFPGEDAETTERVGKKTPRRERPPIQAALRRGQEIAVQVLKEGVGTKGPTVTSYLSIPGRFLVMMPQMDRVGVSRKVEDEETRRKMREILDQLDLPEGFGFILRTAGMERTKVELKRDLAYLQRLWKDMEKRWKSGNKPRLLYSESDLLVRALRDILTGDIDRVVVDNEAAVNRAARFLKIVAPRSATRLVRYTGLSPVYHAMGIEQQIQMIHAREVPLPSGGRLVIDETEALVAIDVNSGKSRDARDAETNAFRTNQEAVDEICRQLRLRDLGGVVINDLIDMRQAKHRRDIENQFRDHLKKDRARWTIAPISEFGILEMTRQRMRGSHESQHFADCPVCRGRGLVQRPDSVAADGLRELASVLEQDRVFRVEMVVNPRIAGELLSSKRRALTRIERLLNKRVDVRVNEATPVDRVTFYAYDDRGADIDVARLGHRKVRPEELIPFEVPEAVNDDWANEGLEAEPEPMDPEPTPELEPHPIEIEPNEEADELVAAGEERGAPLDGERRGRRRRGGRGRGRNAPPDPNGSESPGGQGGDRPEGAGSGRAPRGQAPRAEADAPGDAHEPGHQEGGPGLNGMMDGPAGDGPAGEGEPGDGPRRRRRRRRRRGGGGRSDTGGPEGGALPAGAHDGPSHDHPSHANTGEGPGSREQNDGHEAEPHDGGDDTNRDPNNGPPVDGQPEQGTGRRRRRRRRGRGGRGPDGAPLPPGALPGEGGPNDFAGDPGPNNDHGAPVGDDARMNDSGGDGPGGEGPGEDGQGPAGEGGPRRRRRRRGGRGRGGPGGGGDGGGGTPADGGVDAPANADAQRSSSRPPPPKSPTPVPPTSKLASPGRGPVPKTPAVPKPRTLYASRRRLAPGEKRPGGPEE